MGSYLLGRLLQFPPALLVISVVVFLLLHLTPGDPVVTALGTQADRATVESLRSQLGLDRPLPVQYVAWLIAALHGDLGVSLLSRQSVLELVADRLPVTITLAVSATIFSVVVSLPLGVLSALWPGSIVHRGGTLVGTFGIAIPNFVFALVLILLF